MSPLIIGVTAFIAAFVAEYLHDRWAIRWNQLTNSNIPPWTSYGKMKRKVNKGLFITLLLSCLQWFDLVGILSWKLPVLSIAGGCVTGSCLATWRSMWLDWKEARARFVGHPSQRKKRQGTRESDSEQAVEGDSDQLPLLDGE